MRISILAKAEDVEEVRSKIPHGRRGLIKKVSPTGELPATHYFCCMELSQERVDELLALQDKSIMELLPSVQFLKKWNLKIINTNS